MSETLDTTGYLNEPFIGLTIDRRWTIRAPLGAGGMGQVFLATDEQLLSRQVVVKFLKNQAFQSSYLRNKFKHEMESLIKVRDAGVVGIYGAGTLPDGLPYIVMELIEGQSLQTVLESGAMPFSEVASIIQQLGQTLTAVHEARIIHRDIKPSNIMLCRRERRIGVKLIDFGIARVTDSLVAEATEVGYTIGTLIYMSPEQLSGSSVKLTPASDVFSLALVAYEMLTGYRAFEQSSAVHLHKQHEEGVRIMPKSLRADLPVAAQNVLLKALEFDPARRYQQASEFGDALAQALTFSRESLSLQETTVPRMSPHQEAAFTPACDSPVNLPVNKPQSGRASKLAAVIVLALALVTGIAAVIWYAARGADNQEERSGSGSAVGVQPAEREFAYSLMVTPMKDGKPLQKPFAASPSQTFLSDWQFTILFNSQQDGFLYLLNEGLDEKGTKLLRILFPHPENNFALNAAVKSNQQVQTNASAFDSNPGIEKLWLVWGSQKVPELERVKHLVNSKDLGAIRDAEQSKAIQDFLKQHGEPKPTKELDKATNSVTVKARNEVLIELLELYHN